ncbi:MAG TPA: N-acetylgalactosamine 6-sulfate sulfatase [Porticoccaceae bacterium]|nr:N-acetylgalactosamine 6-sulfate sulfatase [Porticoccaceae bacterium]|tara:strand:+ start:105 stop:1535 length:1431 start_codon:yes stop_codon:yes gene_type:complete
MFKSFQFFVVFALAVFPFGQAWSESRPNILFILLDDLGKEWVSAYGAEDIKTPNIDALAASGMRFENAWSMPQCTPSRLSILTGQYPFRHGWVNHWDTPRWGDAYFDWRLNPSLARIMQSAGYKTVAAGKWQVNDFRIEPQVMQKQGFDDYAMWTGYETGNPASAERYWDPYIHTRTGSKTYEGLFGSDFFTQFIIDFIAENKKQPWFAYYAMNLPHEPFVHTPLEPEVEGRLNKHKAMVRYADFLLGKIMDDLQRMGELDETIIVWTTDNGTHGAIEGTLNGNVVRGGKQKITENGINAPFIVYGKGRVPQGVVTDALVDFTDFLPTFASLAGADMPEDVTFDGVSFANLILGVSEHTPRDVIVSMGGGNHAKRSDTGVENAYVYRDRVIRNKRYKLTASASPDYGLDTLIDLANDPEERVNIIASQDARVVAAKSALARVLEGMPLQDKDPIYTPRKSNVWDVDVSVESQVWKK